MKKVSVITINLNNSKGLDATIKSVLSQTYKDYEYIVIDGGSTDNSAEIIKKYSAEITHLISEKDSGIYNAMNKGIKLANGMYCQFLNSGDLLFDKETLSTVFSAQHDEDILYGNMIIASPNGTTRLGKMPGKLSFKHMMRDTLWHPVSFIKHNLFDGIGLYDEQFSIASDYDFFLKAIFKEKVSTYYLNQTIAVFALDGISESLSNRPVLLAERKAIQRKYFNELEIDAALRVTLYERIIRRLKTWIS